MSSLRSDFNNSTYIIDSQEYSREITTFLRNAENATFTLYEPPSYIVRDNLLKSTNSFILNQGNISELYKQQAVTDFANRVAEADASISKFSTYGSSRRLHFKSYYTSELSIVPTGNMSVTTLQQTSRSKLVRQIDMAAEYLSGGFRRGDDPDSSYAGALGRRYHQVNIAVASTNSELIGRDLKILQDNLANNIAPAEVGRFLRADTAQERLIADIGKTSRGDKITLASPYADSALIADALSRAASRGVDVHLITSNVDTNIDRTTGGSETNIRKFISSVRSGGGSVSTPTANDPLLYHVKAASITGRGVNVTYIGSSNFTNAANQNKSIDYMYVEEGTGHRLHDVLRGHVDTYQMQTLLGTNIDKDGISNDQLSLFYQDIYGENGSYLIPSKYGASYFFGKAIYNSQRVIAGQSKVDYLSADGFASAAYRFTYLAKNSVTPSHLPAYITRYDEEMATPGLGSYINEYFMSKGFGRLYRDEYGLLPSAFGAIGAVIDKSLSFYSYIGADEYLKEESIDPTRDFYAKKEGLFQSIFTFSSSFVLSTSIATLTYFSIGVPWGIITSEIFKYSIQTVLDEALNQTNPMSAFTTNKVPNAVSITKPGKLNISFKGLKQLKPFDNVAQGFAVGLSLGVSNVGLSPDELRAKIAAKGLNKELAEGAIDFFDGIDSIIGYQNIAFRKKAAAFFDIAMDPFLSTFVNPYTPVSSEHSSSNYKRMRNAFSKFSEELGRGVYLVGETTNDVTHYYIRNIGFERAQSIAKSLDELALFLPINPRLWGLGINNYTDPKYFVSLGDVFSFRGVVETFERIAHGGEINRILALSAREEPSNRVLDQFRTRSTSFNTFVKKVFTTTISRLKGSYSLHDTGILSKFRELEKYQIQLIKKNILRWDNETHRITLNMPTDEDSIGLVRKFITSAVEYNSSVESSDILRIVKRQVNSFAEKNYPIAHINNPRKRIVLESGIKKAAVGSTLLALIASSMIFDDLAQSTTGASIFSQVMLSLRAEETGGGGANFTINRILPTSGAQAYAVSLGWSALSIGLGYSFASVMSDFQSEVYSYSDETVRSIRNLKHLNVTNKMSPDVADVAESFIDATRRGLIIPKGNFFRNFAIATSGFLFLRPLGRTVITSGLDIIKSATPFLGNGTITPSTDLILASQLTSYRNVILSRIRANQEVSDIEKVGAYMAGEMTSRLAISTKEEIPDQVRVIARQNPLNFFQLFLAESIKNKRVNEKGEVIDKGVSFYTFGLQSSPILGINLTFSLPVAIDWQKGNGFGFIYNNEPNDIVNFINSLGRVSSTALLFGVTSLSLIESLSNVESAVARKLKYEWAREAAEDLKGLSNLVYNSVKTVDNLLTSIVSLPDYASNLVKAIGKVELDTYNIIFKTLTKKSPATKAATLSRVVRSTLFATAMYSVGAFTYDVFSDNPASINSAGLVTGGVSAFGLYVYMSDDLHPPIQRYINNHFSGLKALTVPSFSKLEKIPLLNRPSLTLFAAGAIAYSYLLTNGEFGYTYGMDTDENGNKSTAATVSRLTTVGLYSLMLSSIAFNFGDIGKNPSEVLRDYNKYKHLLDYSGANPFKIARRFQLNSRGKLLQHYHQTTVDFSLSLNRKINNSTGAELKDLEDIRDLINKINIHQSSKITDIVDGPSKDLYQSLFENKQFIAAVRNKQFLRKAMVTSAAVITISSLSQTVARTVGAFITGDTSDDAISNLMYESELFNPFVQPLVNVYRLLTGWDKVIDHSKSLEDFELYQQDTGRVVMQKGKRIINLTDPNNSKLSNTILGILAPIVVNPMNPYQSVLPLVGVTYKRGEYGAKYRSYIQIQTAGQDISTSVYSMASSFFYKNAYSNKSILKILLDSGIQNVSSGVEMSNLNSDQTKSIAFLILTSTAKLQPLTASSSRKYSSVDADLSVDLVTSDPITSLIIKDRTRRLRELSYQPTLSILSRMLDPFSTSLSTIRSQEFSNLNPLGVEGANQEILKGTGLSHYMTNQLNVLGNLSVDYFRIYFDYKKEIITRSQSSSQDTEALIDSTSLNIINPPLSGFGMIGSVMDNIGSLVSTMLPVAAPLKWGVYLTILGYVGYNVLSVASSYLFNTDINALHRNVDRIDRLMLSIKDPLNDAYSNFYAHPRVTSVTSVSAGAAGEVVVKRGTKLFKITMPSEFSSYNFNVKDIRDTITLITTEVVDSKNKFFTSLDESSQVVAPVISKLFDSASKDDIMKALSSVYEPIVRSYVNSTIDAFNSELTIRSGLLTERIPFSAAASRALSTPDKIQLEKDRLTKEIMKYITEKLEVDISASGMASKVLKHNNVESLGKYLSLSIKSNLVNYFESLSSNLLYMEVESHQWASRISEELVNRISPFIPVTSNLRGTLNASNKINNIPVNIDPITKRYIDDLTEGLKFKGKLRKREMLSKSLGVVGTAQASIEAFDLLSSFSQLAASINNENMDTRIQSDFAGSTVINTTFGVALSSAIIAVSKQAPKLITKGKAGMIAGGLAILALVGLAASKSIYNGITGIINSDAAQSFFSSVGQGYELASRAIGNVIMDTSAFVETVTFGIVPQEAVIQGLGFGLFVLSLVAGLGGKIKTALVAGAKTLGLTTALSSIPFLGEGLIQGTSTVTSSITIPLSRNPIGMWFVSSIDSVSYWNINTYVDPNGSPFVVGTAADEMRSQFQQSYQSSRDWTGARTKSQFVNPLMYSSRYYADPYDRILSQRPASVMDSFVDKELSIRAQYYNKYVFGSYLWNQAIRDGNNARKLRRYTDSLLERTPQESIQSRAVDAQIQRDTRQVSQNIAKLTADNIIISMTTPIARLFDSLKKGASSHISATAIILKDKVPSFLIDSYQNVAYSLYKETPVVHTEVRSITENGQIYIGKGPSDSNDVIRQSLINFRISPDELTS